MSYAARDLHRVLDAVLDGIAVLDAEGRVELLNAEVISVTSGTRTLKDAMSEALRAWAAERTRPASSAVVDDG